jgi:flagellar basal body-associated protein FliL
VKHTRTKDSSAAKSKTGFWTKKKIIILCIIILVLLIIGAIIAAVVVTTKKNSNNSKYVAGFFRRLNEHFSNRVPIVFDRFLGIRIMYLILYFINQRKYIVESFLR